MIAAATLVAAAPGARAGTIVYDSFGPGDSFDNNYGWYSGGPSYITTAFMFNTKTKSGYLDEITVALTPSPPLPPTGNEDYRFAIHLYAHDAEAFTPGAVLDTGEIVLTLGEPPAAVTVEMSQTLFLEAATLYWVGIEPLGTGWGGWQWNSQGIKGVRAHFGLDFYGDVWSVYPNSTASAYRVTLADAPIPLPAGAWLLASALALLGAARNRCR